MAPTRNGPIKMQLPLIMSVFRFPASGLGELRLSSPVKCPWPMAAIAVKGSRLDETPGRLDAITQPLLLLRRFFGGLATRRRVFGCLGQRDRIVRKCVQ